MSRETAVYGPEELCRLARILDRTVATLPPTMQTPANRMEIARIILARAATGEAPLAPLMKFDIAEGACKQRSFLLLRTPRHDFALGIRNGREMPICRSTNVNAPSGHKSINRPTIISC